MTAHTIANLGLPPYLSIEDARKRVLQLSRTEYYKRIARGEFRSVLLTSGTSRKGKRLVCVQSVLDFLARQAEQTPLPQMGKRGPRQRNGEICDAEAEVVASVA